MKKIKYYLPHSREEADWIIEGFVIAFVLFQVEMILMMVL